MLAAERFAPALERTVAALTLAFEFRAMSGTTGASLDLVQRVVGEGAESRGISNEKMIEGSLVATAHPVDEFLFVHRAATAPMSRI